MTQGCLVTSGAGGVYISSKIATRRSSIVVVARKPVLALLTKNAGPAVRAQSRLRPRPLIGRPDCRFTVQKIR